MFQNTGNKLSYKEAFFMIITSVFLFQVLGKRLVVNQNYYNLLVLVLWIVSAIMLSTNTFIKLFSTKKFLLLFGFLIYIFLTGLISNDIISTVKFIFGFIVIMSPIFIADFIIKYKNSKLIKYTIIVSLVVIAYYSIMTNVIINKYPSIARQLASGSDQIMNFYYGLNIGGGYSLIYGLVFASLILYNLYYKNIIKNKSVLLLLFVYIFTILNAGYLIAISLTFLGILFLLFKFNSSNSILLILLAMILITTSLLFNLNVTTGEYLIEVGKEKNFLLDDKVIEIGQILSENQNYDYENVTGRTSRMTISINSFFNSPIIGNGIYTGYNSDAEQGIIGQHSEWIDSLARYGILGFILLLSFLINVFKSFLTYNLNSKVILSIFVLLGFLNPIFNFTIIFSVFFLGQLINEYVRNMKL